MIGIPVVGNVKLRRRGASEHPSKNKAIKMTDAAGWQRLLVQRS